MANANPVNGPNPADQTPAPTVDENGVPLPGAVEPEFPKVTKLESHKATRTDW